MWWDATAASTGVYAQSGLHGTPFTGNRLAKAGKPLLEVNGKKIVFVLIELRNDLDQISGGLGFPRSNQGCFCFKCRCTRKNGYNFKETLLWESITNVLYLADVMKCTITVQVSLADAVRIFAVLGFDDRKEGMHGLIINRQTVVTDISSNTQIPLLKFDRLTLAGSILDIHGDATDLAGTPPYTITFWRQHPRVWIQFYPWLLQVPGVVVEYIMMDDLHMLDQGVTPRIEGEVIVDVLKSGVYGNNRSEKGLELGLLRFNQELRKWNNLRARQLKKCGKCLSKIGRVSLKMLSIKKLTSKGILKAKAAECRDLLPFVQKLLKPATVEQLGNRGVNLKRGVDNLLKAYKLMSRSPHMMNSAKLQRYCRLVGKACKKANVHMHAKWHYLNHFGEQAALAGNPKDCSAYMDESKNALTVAIAQSCHTKHFAHKILSREALICQIDADMASL